MIEQASKAGDTTPAIAPLRTLAELGDEGTGRRGETDLTPRLPFSIHPDWYDRYWYGDRSPSRRRVLVGVVWRLCGELPRAAQTLRRVAARTIQWPGSVHT
jgi:hypothetical protein